MEDLPLRDIHLPGAVSWWPLAPGWWVLVGIAFGLLVAFFIYRRRLRARRAGLRSLTGIAHAYSEHGNTQQLATDVSTLLRRICLTYRPRETVAGLTGKAWRDALAALPMSRGVLSDAVAWQIVHGPYNPAQTIDADKLIVQTRRWLKALPPLSRVA